MIVLFAAIIFIMVVERKEKDKNESGHLSTTVLHFTAENHDIKLDHPTNEQAVCSHFHGTP